MNTRFYVAALLLTLVACNKSDEDVDLALPVGTPACIERMIGASLESDTQEPPARVTRYTYLDDTVYLFTAPCCDQQDALYDGHCNFLCAPSGGFSGGGDGRCPDFFATATNPVEIWQNQR